MIERGSLVQTLQQIREDLRPESAGRSTATGRVRAKVRVELPS